MKRKIALVGMLTAIAVFSTACGLVDEGTASDESTSVAASSQSEPIESTVGSNSEESAEADTSIASTHLAILILRFLRADSMWRSTISASSQGISWRTGR